LPCTVLLVVVVAAVLGLVVGVVLGGWGYPPFHGCNGAG